MPHFRLAVLLSLEEFSASSNKNTLVIYKSVPILFYNIICSIFLSTNTISTKNLIEPNVAIQVANK